MFAVYLLFVILCGLVWALRTLIRSQAREDEEFAELREKDIALAESMKIELNALPVTGEEILILRPDDPMWRSRSDYMRGLMAEAISASRRLGIMDESLLPLRLGVSDQFETIQAIANGSSGIIFRSLTLIRSEMNIRDTVAHEVAHLFDHNMTWHHNPEWERLNSAIFDEMERAREEKATR